MKEYFAEIDEDYILDRFNLTGLNGEVVTEYARALDLITDSIGQCSAGQKVILTPLRRLGARRASTGERGELCSFPIRPDTRPLHCHLPRLGQDGMSISPPRPLVPALIRVKLEKYRKADFGRCPRVYCYSMPLLPVGLSDLPYQKAVKLFCPRCEDIYSPKSNRHGSIDGAYFGTTFPHMFFMVYPGLLPPKGQTGQGGSMLVDVNRPMIGSASAGASRRDQDGSSPSASAREGSVGPLSQAGVALKTDVYEPRIFGFRVHEEAKLSRWRKATRDSSVLSLTRLARR